MAAAQLTATDYTRLDAIQARYGLELHAYHVARWGELNTALHSLLYRHANQPRIQLIVQSLLHNTERYTRMQLTFTDGLAKAEAEHGLLVEHCRRGEIEAARRLLREHIENAGHALLTFIRARSGGG